MRIAQVAFRNFPPFADAMIEFPQSAASNGLGEVQLLTGQNGTGKTRLLCVLAAACGNPAPLDSRFAPAEQSATAVFVEHDKGYGAWINRKGSQNIVWAWGPDARSIILPRWEKNELVAGSHEWPEIASSPRDKSKTALLAFRGMARVSDAAISALAPVKLGSPKEHLAFEPAKNEDHIICQSMANLVTGAAMDVRRRLPMTQSRAIGLLERLEGSLSEITGQEFSFDVTPHPEVRLRVFWGGVTMGLLQLPDGLRSIIGWLVSCVSKLEALYPDHPDPLSVPLVLLLDEPEGHLHPAWQRKVLPAAQMLFPQAQIFAATHSPFVISSVNEGWIHIFRADEAGTVTVDQPRECSKGDTYLDVVEDILGVKEWYDPETEELLAKFRRTRDAVLAGRDQIDELRSQAATIADRSSSLRDLMAREMRQVERVTAQAAAT